MPAQPDSLVRSIALLSELEGQSDRGVAIVGVAWVEEELSAALESFLEKDAQAWKRLFSKSGPLATFSAKIDLARLLGITSKVITSDLHALREIRNEFAHTIAAKDHQALSFATQHVKDKCLALKCIAHESITEPRVAFGRACMTLNADFYLHRFVGQSVSNGGLIHARSEVSQETHPK